MSYQKYRDKAYTKIKKYGAPITVTSQSELSETVYNEETDEYEGVPVVYKGVAIMRNFDQRNIDGSNVKFGDVLFMACINGEPMSNDTVTFQGKDYTVINVSALNPDGSGAIFYNIHAR